MRPTLQQKKQLNQWAGCYRFLFNKTIALLSNKKNKTLRNEYRLRDRLVTFKDNNFYNNKMWLKDCPKSVKQGAIKEAKANYQTCWTLLQKKHIQTFTPPYKTKKNEQLRGWSMSLEKTNISKQHDSLYIFKTLLGEMRYYKTKQLHKLIPDTKPMMDCKIQKSAFGEYFLIVPYVCTPQKSTCNEVYNPVAVDPGVRKFLTTYAPNSKESLLLGNRWSTRLMEILLQMDTLTSKIAKCRNKHDKQRMKKRLVQKRKQVFYLKKELKYQCASYLAKRYDLVMMPKLDSKHLVMKGERRLKAKTVRSLLNAGHSEFFNILKDKCWEHGTYFLHCREEYTSKTCPDCGSLNTCQEVYICKQCGFKHDRDVVGALNILLKGVRNKDPSVY